MYSVNPGIFRNHKAKLMYSNNSWRKITIRTMNISYFHSHIHQRRKKMADEVKIATVKHLCFCIILIKIVPYTMTFYHNKIKISFI